MTDDAIMLAERRTVALCLSIIREVRDGFLSAEYAVGQPLASFQERFACDQAAEAIEREFAIGTIRETETMTDDQIKHMVQRFLGWKLPETFSPDAGISFKPTFNDHLPTPMKHNPTGTNLFSAREAELMVRYMVEGLPKLDAGEELHSHLIARANAALYGRSK